MTTPDRETLTQLREAVDEIDSDLEGAMEEYREIRERIAALREDRRWRLSAIAYLKAGAK